MSVSELSESRQLDNAFVLVNTSEKNKDHWSDEYKANVRKMLRLITKRIDRIEFDIARKEEELQSLKEEKEDLVPIQMEYALYSKQKETIDDIINEYIETMQPRLSNEIQNAQDIDEQNAWFDYEDGLRELYEKKLIELVSEYEMTKDNDERIQFLKSEIIKTKRKISPFEYLVDDEIPTLISLIEDQN